MHRAAGWYPNLVRVPPRTCVWGVGSRRGDPRRPAVLTVDAAAMSRDGRVFYVTGNGVWLTDAVPPRFLTAP